MEQSVNELLNIHENDPPDRVTADSTKPREERECPFCAEIILTKARLCKHCRQEVSPVPNHDSVVTGMPQTKKGGMSECTSRATERPATFRVTKRAFIVCGCLLLGLFAYLSVVSNGNSGFSRKVEAHVIESGRLRLRSHVRFSDSLQIIDEHVMKSDNGAKYTANYQVANRNDVMEERFFECNVVWIGVE